MPSIGRKARTMKKMILAVALLSLTFGSISSQKKTTPQRKPAIKQVQVTTRAVASKGYAVDLTRGGTMYNLASGVDYNRVQVHTSKGDMTVAELIKKSGKNISGPLRVGLTSDVRTMKLGLTRRPGGIGGRGGLNYDCGDLACACTGDDDCNDLFTSDKCGPIAICYPDGCICIRF
jgi:hypothetical protein